MATDVGPLWYNTGTATVAQGDTLVTFQDEGNLYDIVRAGDDFGAHVQRPTRIKSIDQANSQATLAYPWPGPSQTAAPYEISFNPQISAYRIPVRTILGLLKSGNVAALAGLTGEADTMPYFTGPGQMGRTGLTKLARSILGRTDAAGMRGDLDVAQQQSGLVDGTPGRGLLVGAFGLGAKPVSVHEPDLNTNFTETGFYYLTGPKQNAPVEPTQFLFHVEMAADRAYQEVVPVSSTDKYVRYKFNGNWSAWRNHTLQHGNNNNGYYLRVGNVQICWRMVTIDGDTETWTPTNAGPFFGTNRVWNFPASFTGRPVVGGAIIDSARATSAQLGYGGGSNSLTGFYPISMRDSSAGSMRATLIAIGGF